MYRDVVEGCRSQVSMMWAHVATATTGSYFMSPPARRRTLWQREGFPKVWTARGRPVFVCVWLLSWVKMMKDSMTGPGGDATQGSSHFASLCPPITLYASTRNSVTIPPRQAGTLKPQFPAAEGLSNEPWLEQEPHPAERTRRRRPPLQHPSQSRSSSLLWPLPWCCSRPWLSGVGGWTGMPCSSFTRTARPPNTMPWAPALTCAGTKAPSASGGPRPHHHPKSILYGTRTQITSLLFW